MKKVFLFLGACAALSACDSEKKSDGIVQQCGDYVVEITLSESGDTISAVLNGDAVELNSAVSASGAKFDGVLNDTQVTLWNQGDSWTMILDDGAAVECSAK